VISYPNADLHGSNPEQGEINSQNASAAPQKKEDGQRFYA